MIRPRFLSVGMASLCWLFGALAAVLCAQQPPAVAPAKPLGVTSTSTYTQSEKNGETTVEIRNVTYHMSGQGVPGRPTGERLLLRKSTRYRQVLDEIGALATVTLEAWTLGTDPKQKPFYQATITGDDAQVVENAVWVVSRGEEDLQWWSVLKLATAQRLFDTYVPLLHFSISREIGMERYIGLEVPPDDTRDLRLKEAHVVAVFEYASEDQVIREALLTCDDPQRARLLRSYEDTTRMLTGTPRGLTLSISQNYPSPPDTVTVAVPILNDDLDVAHATLPSGLHLAAWKR
ncbi:MAG TPA: hypothetical protein VGG72_36185 [Bryobacteraceae bacterium]